MGLDGSSNLIRLGSHFGNRTFDGLIDDVRVWGRPLSVVEVQKLWGNGMGDLGPNARIEMDSISWSDQLSAKLVLNQPVTDFNASEDLEFSGMSLSSISEGIIQTARFSTLSLIPILSLLNRSPLHYLKIQLPTLRGFKIRKSPRILIFVRIV